MGFLFGGSQNIHTSDQQLGGLRVQTSTKGLPVTLAYGQCRITPNLGWYGDFTAIPHTSTQSSGGKGGGGSVSNTTYTYTAGVALMVCEGPISGYGQVWKDKDITTTAALGLTEFTGSYSQSPWSFLTTNHPSEALSYRGQAYLANGALDLGGSDALPNITVEVNGLLYGNAVVPDANPADVLNDLLTASKYGALFPSAQMGDLREFWAYCRAANLLISPSYSTQRSASDVITELAQLGNSAIVWSEGVLKMIPYVDEPIVSPFYLNGSVPSVAVSVNQGRISITPATPPTITLDSAVPSVSVAAT